MSGKLILGGDHIHNFQDDLESTIYILVWVGVVYSKTNKEQFSGVLDNVLDPRRSVAPDYTAKPDFLSGGNFFDIYKFSDRPCFDELLHSLAHLFAVRYETAPPKLEYDRMEKLQARINEADVDLRAILQETHDSSRVVLYETRKAAFQDYDTTLAYFEEALEERSKWPRCDAAVKQYDKRLKRKNSKSGWDSGSVRSGGAKKERSLSSGRVRSQASGAAGLDG